MKIFVKVFIIVILFNSILSAQDWATAIDTTWGDGLPTADKLKIFDLFWNTIDDDYAGFHNLDVNWDSLRTLYRPEIVAGVSRGRFSGIMNRLATALMEFHTHIYNKEVRGYSLKPGVPLLAYHSAYTVYDNGHFGAGLTPLPDSSALVYTVVDNHPLGLEQGDIILGYDGIPWKYLYQDLLDAELPTTHPHPNIGVGSSEKSVSHLWLMSAGLNWHLFDTVDILKYGSTDTLHLSTSALIDQNMHIFCSEQLPVQGVPMVDLSKWGEIPMVSWGIVDGTHIGYIYVSRWRENENVAFRNAVNSIIADDQITGLILDFRGNPGGKNELANSGLSRLFNFDLNILEYAERSDPDNHFAMVPVLSGYCSSQQNLKSFQADPYLYDRPIAVLTGPLTASAGDFNALRLKYHPMVSIFGKPTNTAFTCFDSEDTFHNLEIPFTGWIAGYAPRNTYLADDPDNYLMHVGFEVDEEVWLTREDVAKGDDTVVKRAMEWIQNLAHAHDVAVDKTYLNPGTDSVNVTARVDNPNQHELSITTVIRNQDSTITDHLNLFDDGLHGDGVADDNLWGNFYLPIAIEEQSYTVSVTTNDLTEENSRTLPNVAWFTSVGPIELSGYKFTSSDTIPNHGDQLILNLELINRGLTAIALKITTKTSFLDTCATVIGFDRIFGDIPPGENAEGNRPYTIEFSDACADSIWVFFKMDIYSDDYLFWSDTFSVFVHKDPLGLAKNDENIPLEFALNQNYPNPFNPSTKIKFALPKAEKVKIEVYNTLGQRVEILLNQQMKAGHHVVEFNAKYLSSGIYFYQIEAGEFQDVKKMLLIK